MAEDAVNAAIRSGNLKPANGCVTDHLHIVGGYGWDPASFTVLAQNYKRMKKTYGGKVIPGAMDSAVSKHLSHAYGTLAERVAAIAQVCDPSTMSLYICKLCCSKIRKETS
jgi:glycerol-3-phosphate dehydrogenase